MTKNIDVVNKEDFYIYIIKMMNLIVELNLIPTEIKLLAKLYSSYDELELKNIPKKDIDNILFSSDTREKLRKELNISYPAYNNLISSLRNKKGLITKNTLHSFFHSMNKFKNGVFSLTFNFKLNGTTKS